MEQQMTYIEADCNDQDINITDAPLIASGDVSTDKVHFTFSQEWDDFTKTAVFYMEGGERYNVLLDSSNYATIPKEVLKSEGEMFFGVFGIKDSLVKTSEVVKYRIRKGTSTDGTTAADPTPDVYTQIIAQIQGASLTFITNDEIDTIMEA